MIEQSDSIGKISEAFSKVQGRIEGAKKTGLNPHFKSKFANLEEVYSVCRQALSDEKIAVMQFPHAEGRVVKLTTLVSHGNEWVKGVAQCEARDAGPQSVGGAITYLRRYALCAIIGIEQIDDDGNAAQDRMPAVISELNKQGKPVSLAPRVMVLMKGKTARDLPEVVRGLK